VDPAADPVADPDSGSPTTVDSAPTTGSAVLEEAQPLTVIAEAARAIPTSLSGLIADLFQMSGLFILKIVAA
jgi:hypothetical protein